MSVYLSLYIYLSIIYIYIYIYIYLLLLPRRAEGRRRIAEQTIRKGGWYGWRPSSSSNFSIRAFSTVPSPLLTVQNVSHDAQSRYDEFAQSAAHGHVRQRVRLPHRSQRRRNTRKPSPRTVVTKPARQTRRQPAFATKPAGGRKTGLCF